MLEQVTEHGLARDLVEFDNPRGETFADIERLATGFRMGEHHRVDLLHGVPG